MAVWGMGRIGCCVVAEFEEWPDPADVAVALTFDVDGEAPWLGEGPQYARRLSMLSLGRFGPNAAWGGCSGC